MVLNDKEDIIGVGVESCIGERQGKSAGGVFGGANPGPDVVIIQVRAPSTVYYLETRRFKIKWGLVPRCSTNNFKENTSGSCSGESTTPEKVAAMEPYCGQLSNTIQSTMLTIFIRVKNWVCRGSSRVFSSGMIRV